MDFAHRRRSGYEDALNARGVELDTALLRSNDMTEEFGYASTVEILDQSRPPTAFLVSSIISALGVRRALEERGLQMGRDISVITYDDGLSYLANGADVPIFTATRSSVRVAGRALSEMLLAQINDPDAPPQHRLLEVKLTVGRSTGPAPATAAPALTRKTTMDFKRSEFPKGFIFGAATSAYQIEGHAAGGAGVNPLGHLCGYARKCSAQRTRAIGLRSLQSIRRRPRSNGSGRV